MATGSSTSSPSSVPAESRPSTGTARSRLGVVLALVITFAVIAGCSDDSSSPSRTIPGPAGAGGTRAAQANPLGTATIVKLSPSVVGRLPEPYCDALREFDNKYGPLNQPQLTVKSFPDGVRLFKIMYTVAPPDIQKSLAEPIAVADKMQAAIDAGTVTDEKSAQLWIDQNLGKEGLQKFLAQMITVLYYSAPQCGIGKPQ